LILKGLVSTLKEPGLLLVNGQKVINGNAPADVLSGLDDMPATRHGIVMEADKPVPIGDFENSDGLDDFDDLDSPDALEDVSDEQNPQDAPFLDSLDLW
jgi:hypothetical protein